MKGEGREWAMLAPRQVKGQRFGWIAIKGQI